MLSNDNNNKMSNDVLVQTVNKVVNRIVEVLLAQQWPTITIITYTYEKRFYKKGKRQRFVLVFRIFHIIYSALQIN